VGITASRLRFNATAKPNRLGTLKGDLIVYGRGDPTFNTRLHGGDIFAALEPLVATLTNAGVKRITGDLVGDESFICGPPYGSGWTWDDMRYYYGAEISALTVNDNTLQLSVEPGATCGAPCQLALSPATTYFVLSNRTTTVTNGATRSINFYRPIQQNIVYVTGQLTLDYKGHTDAVTVHNPAGLFIIFFKEALARRGIKVGGKLRTVSWLDRQVKPLDLTKFVELGAVESLPMRDLVREVQKPSQNLYTDLILAHIGRVGAPSVTSARRRRSATCRGGTRRSDANIRRDRHP